MRIVVTLLAAGLLCSVGCSNQGAQTTSAASVTSTDLKQMVQSKLAAEPQLAQVDVSADAGQNQVTLSGSVPSEQARNDAVDMAKTARANLTVVDKVEVKPPEVSRTDYTADMARDARQKAKELGNRVGQSVDDAWIYAKIEARLANNPETPVLKINVDVNHSVVILRGDVDSAAAKQEAERIANDAQGVKRVRNLLKVKS